jgi:hypothetical protein
LKWLRKRNNKRNFSFEKVEKGERGVVSPSPSR